MEGHLNYTVRSGEMKMWSSNRGGLLGRFDCICNYIMSNDIVLYHIKLYYSQTCIKRPPKGRLNYGLLRQVVS